MKINPYGEGIIVEMETFEKPFSEVYSIFENVLEKNHINFTSLDDEIVVKKYNDCIKIKLRDYNVRTRVIIRSKKNNLNNERFIFGLVSEKLNKYNRSTIEERTVNNRPIKKIPIIPISVQGFSDSGKFILRTEQDGIKIEKLGIFNRGTRLISYADIISLQFIEGLMFGEIEIIVPGDKIQIKKVDPIAGQSFINTAQSIITRKKEINLPKEEKQAVSPMDEIKKAKDLLDMGAISLEEFEKIKNNYLKKI